MTRARPDKRPNPARWFSWSRTADADGAMYRLFRREGLHEDPPRRGPVHVRMVYAHGADPKAVSARRLRMAYRELRAEVDEIDLAAMEATA